MGLGQIKTRTFGLLIPILLLATEIAIAQNAETGAATHSLEQHYHAAQDAQAAGDFDRAEREYQAFLAESLHRLASHRAQAGDFSKAVSLFEQALSLAPDNDGMRLEYGEACFHASDPTKAKGAAQQVLKTEPKNAAAHFLLGRIALQMGDGETAKQELETAVQLDPTFDHGYTLASAYLKLRDPQHANRIFAEMQAGFGDTALIHMQFGRAYAETGYPELAVPEFKKAIAEDDVLAGVHYSLGAAYLVGLSDAGYAEAAPEFRIELKNHPDDLLSLLQLGSIDLAQHNYEEAEKLLSRAATLAPDNPDSFLGLGQVYAEQNRPSDAETAFRKSIALTADVSRNHYQVQRAHYQLGRLLAQTGRQGEAKTEFKLSDQLLKESVASNQGRQSEGMTNRSPANLTAETTPSSAEALDSQTIKSVEAYEAKVTPAVADACNNLGVIAAAENRFATAAAYFRQAQAWNPSLEGIDSNLGRASFSAGLFGWAVPPLTRSLKQRPEDTWMRSALGVSLFRLQRYADAIKILEPLQTNIDVDSGVDYAYAVCEVRSGRIDDGVKRLENLVRQMPKVADIHEAIGEGLAAKGDHVKAAEEFRLAMQLNPADASAKYQYALTLIALEQIRDAETVLSDAIKSGVKSGDAYYELGRLQLKRGDARLAAATLESGTQADPENASVHCELAEAYRQSAQAENAKREAQMCGDLQKKRSAAKEPTERD